MNNPEIRATQGENKNIAEGTEDDEKQKTKTQHNMCWTPLCANKHKQRKLDFIILVELMYIVFMPFDWTRALSQCLFLIHS